MIRYTVGIARPSTHSFDVEVSVPHPGANFRFSIPAWTPGSYLLREFARYLSEPTCTIDGVAVPVCKVAKGTWEVAAKDAAEAKVSYSVYGLELTVRTPHIDDTHAYFVGTNALVYVEGRQDEASEVRVSAPDGWETFCALDSGDDGSFFAPDYDVLADAAFEVGPHRTHSFDVLGVPHRMIFWGDDAVTLDLPRLESDTRKIIETNAAVFDGALPYERYDIVFHITATGRGGLEHLSSTVLATPWRYFDSEEGYAEMLGLISHEHFHVWNVKRIRPRALGPFDYQNENYTTALWVVEGFTSYFDSLGCLRAGVIDVPTYLSWLAKDISRLLGVPGRRKQSLAQSSYDAWIRLYRPDENTPNRTVSYYLKGSLVALAFDLSMRDESDGAQSLTPVMRSLWSRFLEDGAGYDEHAMAAVMAEATGLNLESRVQTWVHGFDDPQFDKLLSSHGIELKREGSDVPWLGVVWEADSAGLRVKHVRDDGPTYGSGLAAGDVVVAIDDRRAAIETIDATMKRARVGAPVRVHAFRRDRLFSTEISPQMAPRDQITLTLAATPSESQQARWTQWTGLPWPSEPSEP